MDAQEERRMKIVKIRPNVFACLMANETANAGFVITEWGVVVIDTLNSPAQGRRLATEIKSRTQRPIRFVVNTHHHYDHVFGNQAFNAPVVANCALAELLAQSATRDLSPIAIAARVSAHPEDRWLADELELVYPHIVFERRLVFDLPPVRTVLHHLGGHTPDSTIADLPDEQVLFAGDLIFEGRVPFLRQAHIGTTIDALRQLEQLGVRTIVPGHGALCDMTYVTRLRTYLEDLRDRVGKMITRGCDKIDVLDADTLPLWWTTDRQDLLRANVARVYDELIGSMAQS
jgi:glyoxylase-like metal-dependent hydrolase (beta-lactamase superfamily II)